jgi:hypothetical protein
MSSLLHAGPRLLLAALLLALAPAAHAKVLLTANEALALAFPSCQVHRATAFLSKAQQERAAQLAAAPVESALVNPYHAVCNGKAAGTAYFDVHRVRTQPERLMIALGPDGKVRRIEVLTFDEPQDYLPRAGWYGQFAGKGLDDKLTLDGSGTVRKVAGATLTAQATSAAVRRVLAIHRVLGEQRP